MTSNASTDLAQEYLTRPGTPMRGPYSTNQMDDFYAAISRGEVRSSGVMNLLQHLIAAQGIARGATVIDVCCGRGLALPLIFRYAPHVSRYIGLDVSPDNLAEARDRLAALRAGYGNLFPADFAECDVAEPWPDLPPAHVTIYTSALEHLPAHAGKASLRHTANAMAPGGVLFLSTPSTPGPPPRPLQHRVHVYEWSMEEALQEIEAAGLVTEELIGLLPPDADTVAAALAAEFGPGAAAWYRHLAARVPGPLLDTISAISIPAAATELLYVCRRP
jgi:SAM-dependent methyltransferase